ncbi:unnamed protein product [Prorocentrum cordatum]|uniref:Beta-galactosidase n=1 Tax=Prorocentrum cordatum TaxID=2364126 RepID=A0ABN9T3Z9_9DINO|nr:unnamed protein product [Polarella glacialis]
MDFGLTVTSLVVTAAAATAAPEGAAVAATGGPRLQNIFGQRSDLMRAGRHALIQIPRGAGSEGTLLRVEAEAQSLGTHCSEMYFQEVSLTGKWVERKHLGGLQFRAADDVTETPKWLRFGSFDLKLVHGRALTGVRFFILHVKRLGGHRNECRRFAGHGRSQPGINSVHRLHPRTDSGEVV